MLEILSRWKSRVAIIILALAAEMAFNAAVPLSLRFVIDRALTPHDGRALVKIILALALGAIFVSGVGLWRNRLSSVLQSEVLARLRQKMFDHLQYLSLASHAGRAPGEVLSRFSGDLSSVETALGMA